MQTTPIQRLDLSLPTVAENLALDELLLARVPTTDPPSEALRFWRSSQYAVVVGSGGRIRDEVDVDACRRAGVDVLRRRSGGGTVLLGPGCLCVSWTLSLATRTRLQDIRRSYRELLGRTIDGLALPGLHLAGDSDLALGTADHQGSDGARKVSGSAQRRTAAGLLHHLTLLVDFDLSRIADCLPEPPRQPDYRRQRAHDAFVTNLGLDADTLADRIAAAWNATPAQLAPAQIIGDDGELAATAARYHDPDWTFRR